MFDIPLHPVAVHFPIVLGVILPLASLLIWWGIKRGHLQQKVWALVIVLALAYSASAFVAVELGERDEDKVEKVVSEKVIEEHEEAGEMIVWIAGTLLLASLAGMLLKNSHQARLVFAVVSLMAIIPLANAGHTGGKLVYQYGAANAHLPAKYQVTMETAKFNVIHNFQEEEEEDDHDDDKDKDDD